MLRNMIASLALFSGKLDYLARNFSQLEKPQLSKLVDRTPLPPVRLLHATLTLSKFPLYAVLVQSLRLTSQRVSFTSNSNADCVMPVSTLYR